MRRLIGLLTPALFLLPTVTFAALVPYACEDPNTCGTCELVSVINNIIQFVVQISTLLAVAAFIYAGFLMVTSQGNEGQITRAKGIFTNVVIGLVIILAAFIIVNTVLAGLLKTGSPIYQWQTIECVYPASPSGLRSTPYSNNPVAVIGTGMPGGGGTSGGPSGPLSQCHAGNTACSVSALMAAGMSQQQANIMSCIAMTESSGVASTPPYNLSHPGSNSSACGTFQIVRTTWNQYATGNCANFIQCTNASCNAQVAQNLVASNGYSDWTCPNCNSRAQACVDRYSN